MASRNIAHFNYGVMRGPLDSPVMAEFVAANGAVHAVAERSEGFVWRYPGDEAADAAALGRPLGGDGSPVICSFSVWRSVTDFETFVHKTLHGRFLRRRAEWFVPGPSEMVLWRVAAGHLPSLSEALDRLDQIRADGPGETVFTLESWRVSQEDA